MSFKSTLADIACDLDRDRYRRPRSRLSVFLAEPGAQATAVYRFGHWLEQEGHKIFLVGTVLHILMIFVRRFTDITTGVYINSHAQIGPA